MFSLTAKIIKIISNKILGITTMDFKKIIANEISNYLEPYGFQRKANNFVKEGSNLNYHIQIQNSKTSNLSTLRFTLNLGISSKKLLSKENNKNFDIRDCHWKMRIGNYKNENGDFWWVVNSTYEAETAVREIINLLTNEVFKEWDKIQTNEDLIKIWKGGKSPGLTNKQRLYYFELIGKTH